MNHMIYNRNLNTFGFVTKINDSSSPPLDIHVYIPESRLSFWYIIYVYLSCLNCNYKNKLEYFCHFQKQFFAVIPVKAGVCDRFAIYMFANLLIAGFNITFYHNAFYQVFYVFGVSS